MKIGFRKIKDFKNPSPTEAKLPSVADSLRGIPRFFRGEKIEKPKLLFFKRE